VNQKQFYFIEKLNYKFQLKIAISFLMEHTYQYAWVIPLLPLPIIMSTEFGLFLIPIVKKILDPST
jgi:hypothetical protein